MLFSDKFCTDFWGIFDLFFKKIVNYSIALNFIMFSFDFLSK